MIDTCLAEALSLQATQATTEHIGQPRHLHQALVSVKPDPMQGSPIHLVGALEWMA